jgi:pyruvate dehydrogenase E1 component beta subunit
MVADRAFSSLKGPIKTLTGLHMPVPFSPPLEDHYIPSVDNVIEYATKMLKGEKIEQRR